MEKKDYAKWRAESYAKAKREAEEHEGAQLKNVGNWRVVVGDIKRKEEEKHRGGGWRKIVGDIKRKENSVDLAAEGDVNLAAKGNESSAQATERNSVGQPSDRIQLMAYRNDFSPQTWREIAGGMKR